MGITLPCRLSLKKIHGPQKISQRSVKSCEIKQHKTYSQSQLVTEIITFLLVQPPVRSNLVSTDVQDSPWLEDVEFCGAKKGRVWRKNPLGVFCKASLLRLLQVQDLLRCSTIFDDFSTGVWELILWETAKLVLPPVVGHRYLTRFGHALKKVMFIYVYPS